jgi:hypothetical protein
VVVLVWSGVGGWCVAAMGSSSAMRYAILDHQAK